MRFSLLNACPLLLGAAILGSTPAAAWYATLYSDPDACTDNHARQHSDYFSYEGHDIPGHLVDDEIPCQSLGSVSTDPSVTCEYFGHDGDANPDGSGCGSSRTGFVARSASLRGLEYCIAWEDSYSCEGDYYVWEIEPPQGACHDGIQVRSFKCLQ